MYTQGIYILCDRCPSVDEVGFRLRRLNVIARYEPGEHEHWSRSCSGWVLGGAYHERSRILVDCVERPWPKRFDDPDDPSLLRSWLMGQFGGKPRADALSYASRQLSPTFQTSISQHLGLIRLRLSYVPEPGEPSLPSDRDALMELRDLGRVAYFILEDPMAIALFSPRGCVLHDGPSVWRIIDRSMGDPHEQMGLWLGMIREDTDCDDSILHLVGLDILGLPKHSIEFHLDEHCGRDQKNIVAKLRRHLVEHPERSTFQDHVGRQWEASELGGSNGLRWRLSERR